MRSERARARARKRCRGETCAICLDPLDGTTTTTACDHAYHRECWHEYIRSHQHWPSLQEHYDDYVAGVLECWLTLLGGPPCPLCRTLAPTLHQAHLHPTRVHLSTDEVLRHVSRKRPR